MLTDEQKAQIRAEEIFRLEIRKELEASHSPSTRWARFWSLLNTSFALWFLSSVVLASLTATYTALQASKTEEARKAQLAARLDTEIGNRLSEALVALHNDEIDMTKGASYAPRWIYANVVQYLDNFFIHDLKNPVDFSVYPEYRNRSFRSLILELETNLNADAQRDLRGALNAYGQLKDKANNESDRPDTKVWQQAVADSRKLVFNGIVRTRWKTFVDQVDAAR
jgi:hypothetical protein